MDTLFWISFGIACVLAIRRLFSGDLFSIYGYILLGIYLPLGLYFAGWSELIDPNVETEFYALFAAFNVVVCLFLVTEGPILQPLAGRVHSRNHGFLVTVLTGIYVVCCLIENWMASGVLLPALSGIDVHTYHAPVIAYITKSLYVVCAINALSIFAARRWLTRIWHFCLIALILFVYVFGKSARVEVAILLVQLVGLCMFVGGRTVWNRRRRIRPSIAIAGVSMLLVVASLFASIGDERSSHYGQYDVASYGDSTNYSGPLWLGDWMSWYYGYFPLSFNNLNLSIRESGTGHSLVGLSTFKWLYYGIFQLDNIFGIDASPADSYSVSLVGQAAVTTGFWDIVFDFGVLSFLVFIGALAFYRFLYGRVSSESASLGYVAVYFYWVPTWFFMSFQNFSFDAFVTWNMVFSFALVPFLFSRSGEADAVLPRRGLVGNGVG